jgi:hypothetical protein
MHALWESKQTLRRVAQLATFVIIAGHGLLLFQPGHPLLSSAR